MGKIVFGVIAIMASIILVESLQCNKCSVGLFGFCLNSNTENCTTSTSVCLTGKATFPSLTSFSGFNTQGCAENSTCSNYNGTLLGATYTVTVACCSSDKCNPITLSGAPSAKLSMSALLGAAVVASMLY